MDAQLGLQSKGRTGGDLASDVGGDRIYAGVCGGLALLEGIGRLL